MSSQSRARTALVTIGAAFALASTATFVACAAESDSGFASPTSDKNGGSDTNQPGDGTPNGDGGALFPGADAGSTAGNAAGGALVLVHASPNLPAFRVCFDGLEAQLPLPDDRLMPNANVVGVDVGWAVHVGSLTSGLTTPVNTADASVLDDGSAATASDGGAEDGSAEGGSTEGGSTFDGSIPQGQIHVIEEKLARGFYPSGSDAMAWPNCGALVKVLAQNGYEGHGLYTLTGDQVQSVPAAQFIAIEGCLPDAKFSMTECGGDYDAVKGNLKYEILSTNQTSPTPDKLTFIGAVLSPKISGVNVLFNDALSNNMGTYSITKGSFSSLGTGAAPTMPADFDTAQLVLSDANGPILTQTLAQVQAFSAPNDLPQTFYGLSASFAVFVVGDPAIDPSVDPAHALHFLAVPTIDPRVLTDGGVTQ